MSGCLITVTELVRLRNRWRRTGRKVVFTNGVFDLLHVGHVALLRKAKAAGDILVVGLNTDASVRRLKGRSRPINKQKDRAAILCALADVDYVCLFGADTPRQLIARLVPDVLVKGAEYATGNIVGADTVLSSGGQVLRVPMRAGKSTTRMLKRLGRVK